MSNVPGYRTQQLSGAVSLSLNGVPAQRMRDRREAMVTADRFGDALAHALATWGGKDYRAERAGGSFRPDGTVTISITVTPRSGEPLNFQVPVAEGHGLIARFAQAIDEQVAASLNVMPKAAVTRPSSGSVEFASTAAYAGTRQGGLWGAGEVGGVYEQQSDIPGTPFAVGTRGDSSWVFEPQSGAVHAYAFHSATLIDAHSLLVQKGDVLKVMDIESGQLSSLGEFEQRTGKSLEGWYRPGAPPSAVQLRRVDFP